MSRTLVALYKSAQGAHTVVDEILRYVPAAADVRVLSTGIGQDVLGRSLARAQISREAARLCEEGVLLGNVLVMLVVPEEHVERVMGRLRAFHPIIVVCGASAPADGIEADADSIRLSAELKANRPLLPHILRRSRPASSVHLRRD